jgi:hypothetical protein
MSLSFASEWKERGGGCDYMQLSIWTVLMNYFEDWVMLVYIHCKKGKALPLHAMEAPGGRGGIAPIHC